MKPNNPLYETLTYMGSLDDMSKLYSDNCNKHQRISSIICEHLLLSGPMLINDMYLVQQPEFIDLCDAVPKYLEAALEHKKVRILARGRSLMEVIEEAGKSGVIGHQLYKDGEYKKHKKQIEKMDRLFVKYGAYIDFPKKDLTSGYVNLLEELIENTFSENYDFQDKKILAPIVEKSITRIKSEGKAARTQYEKICCETYGYSFREGKSLDDPRMKIAMRFANEIYHHNLSLLISNDLNAPIFCDTIRSGAFDRYLDDSYKTRNTIKKEHMPFIRPEWLVNRSEELAGLFDEDNSLYSIKREYLKELFRYMNNSKSDDSELVRTKNLYQNELATKLGFLHQVENHFNRIFLGKALASGVLSTIIGSTVAPQLGAASIIATVILVGAQFAFDNATTPWITNKSLNIFFANGIDSTKMNIASAVGYSSLPLSQNLASEFSSKTTDFS